MARYLSQCMVVILHADTHEDVAAESGREWRAAWQFGKIPADVFDNRPARTGASAPRWNLTPQASFRAPARSAARECMDFLAALPSGYNQKAGDTCAHDRSATGVGIRDHARPHRAIIQRSCAHAGRQR